MEYFNKELLFLDIFLIIIIIIIIVIIIIIMIIMIIIIRGKISFEKIGFQRRLKGTGATLKIPRKTVP